MKESEPPTKNPDAIPRRYAELDAMIDGRIDNANTDPIWLRRRACVEMARDGDLVLAD